MSRPRVLSDIRENSFEEVSDYSSLPVISEESDEDTENESSFEDIYLEVVEEEGRQFTSITTFHGMIRVFSSNTWTSLAFWVTVVMTCLTFYMIFAGYILNSYSKGITFFKTITSSYSISQLSFFICSSDRISLKELSPTTYYEENDNCLWLTTSLKNNQVLIEFNANDSDYIATLGDHDIALINNYSYTVYMEAIQVVQYLSCSEIIYKVSHSFMKRKQPGISINIKVSNLLTIKEETKKMEVIDVLSLLGGGTSLFMGCSCVTLMETFIFLFKLVVQSFTRGKVEDKEDFGDLIESPPNNETSHVAHRLTSISEETEEEPLENPNLKKNSLKSNLSVRFKDETAELLPKKVKHPSLGEMKSVPHFNVFDSVGMERTLRTLSTGSKVVVEPTRGTLLKRQNAVDIPEGNKRHRSLVDSTSVDELLRTHPSRIIVRRLSLSNRKGSTISTGSANIRVIQTRHPSIRLKKLLPLQDF